MFVYYFRSGEVSLGRVLNSPTELGPSPLAGVTHLEKKLPFLILIFYQK